MEEKLAHPSWLDAYEKEEPEKLECEEVGGEKLLCPGTEEGRLICD